MLRIDTARTLAASTSTQENAWLVLAARALAKQLNSISLNVNGRNAAGARSTAICGRTILHRPLRCQNNGDGNVSGGRQR